MPPCSGGRSAHRDSNASREEPQRPKDPLIGRHHCAEGSFNVERLTRSTSVATGSRPMKENLLQRSPFSTDSSKKPGPSSTSFETQRPESRDRQEPPSTPEQHCGQRHRQETRRLEDECSSGLAKRPVKTCPFTGVTGAAAVLHDLEEQCVAITVVVRLTNRLVIATCIALAPQFSTTPRPIHHAAFSQRAI